MEKTNQTVVLQIAGLDCQDEKALLEKKMGALEGVAGFEVNIFSQHLRVTYDPKRLPLHDIIRSVAETGMKARVAGRKDEAKFIWWKEKRIILLALSGILTTTAYLLQVTLSANSAAHIFYLLAIVTGGYYPAKAGLSAARAFTMNINTLLILAAVGAVGLDLWGEAAVLVFIYSLGNVLETFVVNKARGAITSLMALLPKEALVRRDGSEITLPTGELQLGDVVIVRPGEKIPIDGIVVEGSSFVDESMITGEPVPNRKTLGKMVFAGTLNQKGSLGVRVTKRSEDTTLAKIIHSVEEAQAKKSSYQLFGEKFGRIYTPIMFALGVGVAVFPPLIFGAQWQEWIYRGLVVFVVSCSCGLALSVPVAIVAAVGNSARKGILFKGGLFLEKTQQIEVVAFDKTGTLTLGRPSVYEITGWNGFNESELLSIAAAIESRSEHPIADAIVRKAKESGHASFKKVERFQASPGRGISATVEGKHYLLGNRKFFDENAHPLNGLEELVETAEREGKTVVIVGEPAQCLGFIAVSDTLKPEAQQTVTALKRRGLKVVMLTGDTEATGKATAEDVGIDDYRASLLPEEKIDAVSSLRNEFGPVMMVGDGINDSPAMAVSDVGVAMGAAGTDVAMETGDVVLMADDLSRIPQLFAMSRRTVRNIKQNIVASLLIIAFLVPAALMGWIELLSGLLLNEGAALLVILNGLRLLK
ncbi:MAG: heavy metal translocating P-type ATPase [Candidatus Latescibacteria bacterium]|nr:heavy metal translocating P-type ATPase [Candidatus Latescibacterota bacterium]NIM21196.1 heavy metal translocating P-type ATPase [Candidatus Latescibacterota bacterium]NIM65450.1 heavy metal translocating P-type ATPase [Candidatus Latescibacterota bacterium]NIO01828.1 heavy metal translocating P-type ATPase [Candidatus Latescibacterota bacterium]NIO28478.1 heavy metal translocating P-type ATPase [Candidatus Latescibacterota bacterium]